jgi:hypothetical protein
MEVVYSLTLTLWTIIKITVSNPLLLITAMGSLLTIFIKRYARS